MKNQEQMAPRGHSWHGVRCLDCFQQHHQKHGEDGPDLFWQSHPRLNREPPNIGPVVLPRPHRHGWGPHIETNQSDMNIYIKYINYTHILINIIYYLLMHHIICMLYWLQESVHLKSQSSCKLWRTNTTWVILFQKTRNYIINVFDCFWTDDCN